MRIRSIKPEFWRSEDIAKLGWDERLLFIGLWSYVDDNGVGRDSEKLVAADLFALEDDPRETLARVSRGLQKLFSAGLIDRYEVDGHRYLHIKTWAKHQRVDKPQKPRYPDPTSPNAVFATSSRECRESVAPGTGEQGNRGTGEQGSLAHPGKPKPKHFDDWWSAYPRKVAKGAAEKAYAKAVASGTPEEHLIERATTYARVMANEDRKFIPYPATWLNRASWEDDMDALTASSQPSRQTSKLERDIARARASRGEGPDPFATQQQEPSLLVIQGELV